MIPTTNLLAFKANLEFLQAEGAGSMAAALMRTTTGLEPAHLQELLDHYEGRPITRAPRPLRPDYKGPRDLHDYWAAKDTEFGMASSAAWRHLESRGYTTGFARGCVWTPPKGLTPTDEDHSAAKYLQYEWGLGPIVA